MTGNGGYVVLGGEFTKVNNKDQQGLVRFATSATAPNAVGPELFNTTWPIRVNSTGAGTARINWTTNTDDDSENLTYKVYRDVSTKAGLVYTTNASANFWNGYTLGYTDTGLAPGSTHQYRVTAVDAFGNTANSPWTSVTVGSGSALSPYVKAVYNSQPLDFWRFDEPSGTTAADLVGTNPMTTGSGVTHTAGGLAADTDTAGSFNGTSNGIAYTTKQLAPLNTLTLDGWFKTTTAQGGKLIGFGDKTSTSSSNYDRQIYMDNAGHILFGVNNGTRQTVASTGDLPQRLLALRRRDLVVGRHEALRRRRPGRLAHRRDLRGRRAVGLLEDRRRQPDVVGEQADEQLLLGCARRLRDLPAGALGLGDRHPLPRSGSARTSRRRPPSRPPRPT